MLELDVEIPARWVLFVYLTLEILKFVYERFVSQQEYLRILRDIAASQHATALILEKIAQSLSIEELKSRHIAKKEKQNDMLETSGRCIDTARAQSSKPRKMNRFDIGSALNGSQKKKNPQN